MERLSAVQKLWAMHKAVHTATHSKEAAFAEGLSPKVVERLRADNAFIRHQPVGSEQNWGAGEDGVAEGCSSPVRLSPSYPPVILSVSQTSTGQQLNLTFDQAVQRSAESRRARSGRDASASSREALFTKESLPQSSRARSGRNSLAAFVPAAAEALTVTRCYKDEPRFKLMLGPAEVMYLGSWRMQEPFA